MMLSFKKTTITGKLKLIILLACAVTILIGEGASMLVSFFSYQKNLSDDLAGLAHVIGQNARVALLFEIPEDAEKVLQSLAHRKSVQTACVYDQKGVLFASYRQPGATGAVPNALPLPESTVAEKGDGFLQITVPIVVGEKRVGALRMTDDMSTVRASLVRDALIYGVIILAVLLLAYLLSLPLQKMLTEPILQLGETARTVSRDRDFSVRALKKDDDEIGALTDSFNAMLDQIQNRERALLESEERFRAIAENSPDAIITADRSTNILYCNSAAEKMFGYTRKELVGQSSALLLPQRLAAKEQMERGSYFDGGNPGAMGSTIESVAVRKDGTEFPIEFSLFSWEIENIIFFAAIIRDITERKRSQEALQEGRKLLFSIVDTAVDAIITTNSRGEIISWNKAAERIYGFSAEETIGRNVNILLPEKQRQRDQGADLQQAFEKQKGAVVYNSFESVGVRKDGTEFPMEISRSMWASGKEFFATAIIRDITERKRAEQERARLATAIEQASEGVMLLDMDSTVIYTNPAMVRITGYPIEKIMGKGPFPPGVATGERYDHIRQAIIRGESWSGEISTKKTDGTLYILDVAITPLQDHEGAITGYVALCNDVTEKKKLEQQLWQSQKMEAIGTLAGGIAHDFNNILGAIIGFTELSQDLAAGNSSLENNLMQVLQAGDRAKNLVKQILTFSRKNEHELKPIQTHLIVKEALKLLRASIPSTIDIRYNIADRDDIVVADATQIHQIVMNLCTNAAHAMQQAGGLLEITLQPVDIDAQAVRIYTGIAPGPYLQLSVRDTGTGIPGDIIGSIFDPFFTTKEVDKGTGMGLSVVLGIVKSLKGDIKVYSEPGKGTVFHALLPRVQDAQPDRRAVAQAMPKGTGSVLMVDDEELLLDMGKQILSSLGYRITTMRSSLEALELFKKTPSEFDIVITDQTMPQLTGHELAQRLMQVRPDIPIILCTGYSDTVTEESALGLGIKAFIIKPLNRLILAETIRRVLDARQTA